MINFILTKYKKVFLYLYLISFHVNANILLQPAQKISDFEIEELANNWETQFTWNFKTVSFSCYYENRCASFIMQFFKIPLRSYKFQYISNIKKLWACKNNIKRDYYFSKPLQYKDPSPKIISLEDFGQLLKNKRYIFYTGAGISASQVPTMNSLMESLSMHKDNKTFLNEVIFYPGAITNAFGNFCRNCIENLPTEGHYVLQRISCHKKIAILTENVDLLQQRTGIKPIHTHADEMYSLKSSDWNNIDIIVCVGLSHDDCGLLGWYKENNPLGTIIAIDLNVPNYLSDKDFILQGDLQLLLPSIENLILQK